MYYGFPDNTDGLMDYLRDIFKGRDPPDFIVQDNRRKIEMLGGSSPSTYIVRSIRDKIERSVKDILPDYKVVLLAKHVNPSINDAARMLGTPDITVEVPLFPIYSSFIFSSYFEPFENNVRPQKGIRVSDISSDRNIQEHFINEIKKNYDTTDKRNLFVFTSHSIPVKNYDPYPKNILDVARNICSETGISRPFLVYHSRGPFGKNWLGPDFEYLRTYCSTHRVENVIAIPVGFLYDHLEVLYDLDIDLSGRLAKDGIGFKRIPLPNDSNATISAILSSILRNIGDDI